MIRHIALKHGWYYFYRIHEKKSYELTNNGLSGLRSYLNQVAESCPNQYFESGPRGSCLNFKLPLELKPIEGHEICNLTKCALNNDLEVNPHTKVELFLLQNDPRTLAVEVPIWLKHNELENFNELFKSKTPLTGHIDILRVEDNNVWIWDYKPNAPQEKFAATQTFFYALMLSQRSNIPLENFRCGYFDTNVAYVFKPEITAIKKNIELSKFI